MKHVNVGAEAEQIYKDLYLEGNTPGSAYQRFQQLLKDKHGEEKYFSNFSENILLHGPLSFQKQNNFKKSGKPLKKYIFI